MQKETKLYQMVEGASLLDENLCRRMSINYELVKPIGFVKGIVSILSKA